MLSNRPSLEGALRRNRLDGAGLYFGRRGRIGPVDAGRLEAFLRAWVERAPYLRMGVLPAMSEGLFDDGRDHAVDALLGDRFVDLVVDDDFVIPGMVQSQLPTSMASKQTCMKASDREAFVALAGRHGLRHEGMLDGPWTLALYRVPTFGRKRTPRRVELLTGIGMRPKDSKRAPPPEGMTLWKNPKWDIACCRVAELRAPAITLEVDSAAVERALDEALRAVRSAAETTPWREMMDAAGWTDADLEPQLYIRLDQPDDARQGSAPG